MKRADQDSKHRWHNRTTEDHRHELGRQAAVAIHRQNGDNRDRRIDEITFLARRTRNMGVNGDGA